MNGDVIEVYPDSLVGWAVRMKNDGCRLVTMTCVELNDQSFHILYHFDKAMKMTHLRLAAPKGGGVPSISRVYFSAFLVENEIRDLFGIRFDGLLVDYDGTFYLEEEVTAAPLCRSTVGRPIQQEST